MRVAAISDIHANLRALEVALADVERKRVDSVVVVGDTRDSVASTEYFESLRAT